MHVAVFSVQNYEMDRLQAANISDYHLILIREALSEHTVERAKNCPIICCFVNDQLNASILRRLSQEGVRLIVLRSSGYDHIDLCAAQKYGLTVTRVPDYSPQAVAEFAVGLILSLSRHIPLALSKARRHDFSLDGLLGFNLENKVVGVVGTGHIGTPFAKIMKGFGCRLMGYDPFPNEICMKWGMHYTDLDSLLKASDIVSLHCLLDESTHHIINHKTLALMKRGAMLINTGRGGLVDTAALIHSLQTGQIGFAGLDVYEHEKGLFFEDHSHESVNDPLLSQLEAFPNMLVTGHMAFLTHEAIDNIVKTVFRNIDAFLQGRAINVVTAT